jgi:pyruvate/2-oxoglutarate dehydrogenase complex dihydrolipoamide acyltransferase (E2) component
VTDSLSDPPGPSRVPILVPSGVPRSEPVLLRQWLVSLGELVSQGERVCELSVPGVLIHVAAPCSGTVESLSASPLTQVDVSGPIGWIVPDGPMLD